MLRGVLKPLDRVSVDYAHGRKYGSIAGECKDRVHWMVLIDGNIVTSRVHRDRITLLTPQQLAFHLVRRRA